MQQYLKHRSSDTTPFTRTAVLALGLAVGLTLASRTAAAQDTSRTKEEQAGDWAAVDQALGRKGTQQPGGVMRYSFPRSDLHVTADGVQLKPAFALGGWIAFHKM